MRGERNDIDEYPDGGLDLPNSTVSLKKNTTGQLYVKRPGDIDFTPISESEFMKRHDDTPNNPWTDTYVGPKYSIKDPSQIEAKEPKMENTAYNYRFEFQRNIKRKKNRKINKLARKARKNT